MPKSGPFVWGLIYSDNACAGVIEWSVTEPVRVPSESEAPRSALSEEQRFCNDALASREFDAISDEQWVALCEQVALEARHPAPDPATTKESGE